MKKFTQILVVLLAVVLAILGIRKGRAKLS